MGLFSSNAFEPAVDKATSEENTGEDWGKIMAICDLVSEEQNGPKECLKAIYRRLNSNIPVVVLQSLALIDACISNCGRSFHLEVASREFEQHILKFFQSSSPYHSEIVDKAKELLEKWAKEFKNDSQLSLIPELYFRLKNQGVDFSSMPSKRKSTISDAALKNPDAVSSAQEEADILKAIELSMKDVKVSSSSNTGNRYKSSASGSSSLYPSMNKTVGFDFSTQPKSIADSNDNNTGNKKGSSSGKANPKEFKVRALYDFEAVEENELTFKTGEIIMVSDNSDANWWKGSNHRGEGLFPSNFVSQDLNAQPDSPTKDKKVQFKDQTQVLGDQAKSGTSTVQQEVLPQVYQKVTEIDESRMDRLLYLLHEADPHSEKADSDELLGLEQQCCNMIPLIDRDIDAIDREHAELSELNDKLNSALTLYHELMKEAMVLEKRTSLGGYANGYDASAAGYVPAPPTTYGQVPMTNGQYGPMPGQPQQYSQYPGMSQQPQPVNYYSSPQSTNIQPANQYPLPGPQQQPVISGQQQPMPGQLPPVQQQQPQAQVSQPMPSYSHPQAAVYSGQVVAAAQPGQIPADGSVPGSVVNLL